MNPASTLPDRFDRISARVFQFIGQASLLLLVWFSLMKFPSTPAADLDPSWRMALGYAELHDFQFGKDLIFTYGPLGYLLPATNIGEHFGHHIAWQLGANAVFALSIFLLGNLLHGWRKVAYYVYFLAFGVGYIDVVHMIGILLLGFALLRETIIERRWLAALIVVALAVLALVKFTNLLVAFVSVACAAGYYLHRRRWADAALVGGVFLAGFLGGWVACHQHLANLPAYLADSLDVSNGYAEGMGLYGPTSMLLLGIGANLALGAYFALTLYRPSNFPRALTAALIAAAATYMNWKHGFVRADGHVLASFFLCLFFVSSATVLLQDDSPLRRTKGSLLVICGALSLVGIWSNAATTVTDAAGSVNYRVKENIQKVANLTHLSQLAREEFASISQLYQMPGTKAVVGHNTVDILGSEQSYAFFNGLNYRPRPVFQGYFPYTEKLAHLNGAFMETDRAPEFVLQKMQTLDYRLPTLDDSLVTRYLYHHYTYLMEDHDFLVWRRNKPDAALDRKTPISNSIVHFGEHVTPPDLGEDPIWCEIDVQPSLLGRLRSFLYKPPFLKIAVSEGSGSNNAYRLVSGMARAGFLVYPHLTSNHAIKRFEEGAPAPRIAWFSIEMDERERRFFQRDIRVKLYRLPLFTRSQAEQGVKPEIRYRVFSQVPAMVNAAYPTDILVEDHKEVLLAHPPSSLEFELSPQNRHITGHFGLIANAYTNGNTSDGAEFIIEWVNPAGEMSRVFYRLLKPLTIPEDRGDQTFDFKVPPGGGRLIMRTTPGPDNNVAYDWTYWTDVKFAP